MNGMRRRSGDTLPMMMLRWFAGIGSALTIAAVSWTAGTIFSLTHRADVAEYVLRFHGLWVGP